MTEFFHKPEYREYVGLLVQLQRRIADGTDEGPEGELLYHQMDACSESFSDAEIVSLHGVSEDLYSLAAEAEDLLARTPEANDELAEAMRAHRAGDFVSALELLRRNRRMIEPSQLAYLRCRVLSDAGLDDVAFAFIDLASHLDHTNGNYQFLRLDMLKRFDQPRALEEAREILAGPDDLSIQLLLKAAEIQFNATRELSSDEARKVQRGLLPVFEKSIVVLESDADPPRMPLLLPLAYTLCGLCFQDLGRIEDARRCFDQALKLDRDNDALFTARGILLYGRDTNQAVADFMMAVGLKSRIAWPYLHLAHHFLLHNRYEACLDMCNQAIRLPMTDEVRANCIEWMAICEAMLGFDRTTVLFHFDRALQFAPGNTRIAKNRKAFDEHSSATAVTNSMWERNDVAEVPGVGSYRAADLLPT